MPEYLSLNPARDVIETPITDDIDLNGWDVRKAIGLLLKTNAVVSEWIASPIRYRPDDAVVAPLTAFADAIIDPRGLAHHYASLGRNAAERWLDAKGAVPVKRYFYALRPALAIRALRLMPGRRPPMNLQALVAASDLPSAIVAQVEELVEAKRSINEHANGKRLPDIDTLIRDELGHAGALQSNSTPPDAIDRADALFLALVNEST